MLIILEGVSGVGKTTIMHEYTKKYNDAVLICRFTPSTFVYGKLKSRQTNMTLDELLAIDKKIKDFAIVFHFSVEKEILEKREGRDDTELDNDMIENLYDEYYSLSPLYVEKIDVSYMKPYEIVEEMRKRMKRCGFL